MAAIYVYLSSQAVQHASSQAMGGLISLTSQIAQSASNLIPSPNSSGSQVTQSGTYFTPTVQTSPSTIFPLTSQNAASTPQILGFPQSSTITNVNISQSGQGQGTPKPSDAPSGTKPIDQTGLPRDAVHQIKQVIDAGPKDWVGRAPNGDIITGTPDGKTINHGPIQPYGN